MMQAIQKIFCALFILVTTTALPFATPPQEEDERALYSQKQMTVAMQGSKALMQTRCSLIINSGIFLGQVLLNNPLPVTSEALKLVSWATSTPPMIQTLTLLEEKRLVPQQHNADILLLRKDLMKHEELIGPMAFLLCTASYYLSPQHFDVCLILLTVGFYYYQINLLNRFENALTKSFGAPTELSMR